MPEDEVLWLRNVANIKENVYNSSHSLFRYKIEVQ